MPRNGSGTYSLPQSPFVAGTVISSAAVNSDFSDIATALTGSLPRDGQAGMTGQLKITDGSAGVPSAAFNTDSTTGFYKGGAGNISVTLAGVLLGAFTSTGFSGPVTGKVSGLGSIPVGGVINWADSSAPSGWLLCFGQAVSRTTYATLFGVITTTYGSGDGSTTFNIPDLRGSLVYGQDNMGGSGAGRLTTAQFGTDPNVVGNRGGAQTTTLITGNLPAYTPSGSLSLNAGSLTGTANFGGSPIINVISSGIGGGGSFGPAGGTSVTISGAPSGSFTGNAQGGSSTPIRTLPSGLIMAKIIYAGV